MGPFQRMVEQAQRPKLLEGSTGFGVGGGIWVADLLDDIVRQIQKPIFDAITLELVTSKMKIKLRDASSIGLEMALGSEDGLDPFALMSLGVYPLYDEKAAWPKWKPAKFKAMFPQTWELFDKYGAETTCVPNGRAGFVFRTFVPIDMKGSRVAKPDSIPKELIGA